jgi:hypothetical protein
MPGLARAAAGGIGDDHGDLPIRPPTALRAGNGWGGKGAGRQRMTRQTHSDVPLNAQMKAEAPHMKKGRRAMPRRPFAGL